MRPTTRTTPARRRRRRSTSIGGGPSLIGYGAGATCGVNGLACFTRDVPDGFTMWFREQGHVFDWGTMKWCEAYASPPNGCYDAENIALDEFGHVEGLGHHDNFDSDSDYRDAVVQTYSRTKPAAGLQQARLRAVRCGAAPDHVRHADHGREVLDLPRHVDRPDDRRLADPDRGRQRDHAGRHAQGRRFRTRMGASAATWSRAGP